MREDRQMLSKESLTAAAECLKVMAHPIRLQIVDVLMRGEYAVHELAEMCDTAPHQMCEHLRLMKGHGLLSSERRGRTVYYGVAAPNLPDLLDCVRKHCGKLRE